MKKRVRSKGKFVARPINDRIMECLDVRSDYECWEWVCGRHQQGYGIIQIDDKKKKAHRVVYEMIVGPIPPGMKLLHKCDNPPCCNPNHLFLGTQADNIRDCESKGRSIHKAINGSRNGMAKLNEEDIVTIRRLYADGAFSQYHIASNFGVSQTIIHRVVTNKAWRHVDV